MTDSADSTAGRTDPTAAGRAHLHALGDALARLEADLCAVELAADEVAMALAGGGRMLAVGNGGSAAQAQHLTSELVGRFERDRPALSAICLVADVASLTALANDFGAGALFERQVEAHGRAGDVLVALSTSGRSPNVLRAAQAARRQGLRVVALTGPDPNPLAALADRHVAVSPGSTATTQTATTQTATIQTATIQEVHQVVIHLLCARVEQQLFDASARCRPAAVAVAR